MGASFSHPLKTLETIFPDKSAPKCQYGLWNSIFIAGLHKWMRYTLWLLLAFLTLLYFYTANGTQQAKAADMFSAASILNSKKAFYFSIDFFFPPLSLANTLMQFTCTPHFVSIYLSSAQAHFWLCPHVDYITKCWPPAPAFLTSSLCLLVSLN